MSPVVLFCFNRPSETKKVFKEIKKIKPLKIFLIMDGPRKNNKKAYYGIANIGNRPTFNEKKVFFENHFFEIKKNFYGKDIFVELLAFLRKEKKFENIELLKKQINKDILLAKRFIK